MKHLYNSIEDIMTIYGVDKLSATEILDSLIGN